MDTPTPYRYNLWKHFSDNYNLMLLESELNDIVHACESQLKSEIDNLQIQRDQALHLLSGRSLTMNQVAESGLGVGALIDRDNYIKQVQREAMLSILRLFGDDAKDCDCENCNAARTARKMIENL